MGKMWFTNDETLAAWLATTERGAQIVQDVLLGKGGDKFMRLLEDRLVAACDGRVVIRPEPTLALVEVNPKWPMTVRVYGKNHLRAKVIELPRLHNPRYPRLQQQAEIAADELLDLTLPLAYRSIRWPSYARCEAVIRNESPAELKRRAMTYLAHQGESDR